MKQYKILFAEDYIEDMELAEQEFKKAGMIFISKRVETKSDFVFQLENFQPDVVISDYTMPGFNGMQALKIVLELSPLTPVIMFTGSINEETAVSCMKAGAFDYILKDKIRRLPYAISEAFQKSQILKDNLKAHQDLGESEERYKELFISMAQGVIYMNASGEMYNPNPAAHRILEIDYSINEDINLLFNEWVFTTEDGKILAQNQYHKSNSFLNGEKINNILLSAFNKRLNLQKWLLINAIPQLRINETTPYQAFITFEDITDRKKAEIEISRSESAYRFLFEANPHPMWVYNTETLKIMSVNNIAVKKYGYSHNEFINKGIDELWADESKKVKNILFSNEVIENSGPWTHSLKNGEEICVEISSHNLMFEGTSSRIIVAYDLTKRINAEIALKESETKYRTLFENSPIGIYSATLDGEIKFANEALVKLLQYDSVSELLKVPLHKVYVNYGERVEMLKQLNVKGYLKNYEIRNRTKTGEVIDLMISALLQENQVTGMIMDISERKKSELELLLAKQKAEESDKLKTAFLANLSHEVRTPMNAILGFSELLADQKQLDETEQFYVDTIHDNSIQLLNIISDIVEISKIETETVVIYNSNFELTAIKQALIESYYSLAEQKGLKLKFSGFDSDVMINSDEEKLKRIISNLVNNAIKFTDTGEIKISSELKPNSIEFYINDTGIGVPSGHDEMIFERFRQSEEGFSRKHGGTGLGLSIAKAYTIAMGGKIWFNRNAETGTTFAVSLPLKWTSTKKAQNNVIKTLCHPDFSPFTVLIAEDDATNYAYISRLLAPTNVKIIYASNGLDAIEQLDAHNEVNLILMDIKMPVMNGFEATQEIRKRLNSIPIVATTAYAMSGDKEKCLASGCTGYISKPIKRNELYDILQTYLVV